VCRGIVADVSDTPAPPWRAGGRNSRPAGGVSWPHSSSKGFPVSSGPSSWTGRIGFFRFRRDRTVNREMGPECVWRRNRRPPRRPAGWGTKGSRGQFRVGAGGTATSVQRATRTTTTRSAARRNGRCRRQWCARCGGRRRRRTNDGGSRRQQQQKSRRGQQSSCHLLEAQGRGRVLLLPATAAGEGGRRCARRRACVGGSCHLSRRRRRRRRSSSGSSSSRHPSARPLGRRKPWECAPPTCGALSTCVTAPFSF
jgi:hypothetical protein